MKKDEIFGFPSVEAYVRAYKKNPSRVIKKEIAYVLSEKLKTKSKGE
jgi:hypothetical protein